MAILLLLLLLHILLLLLFSQAIICSATVFTLRNSCPFTIWPASSGPSSQVDEITGFLDLPSNSSTSVQAPAGWTGRMWARTGCLSTSLRSTCSTGNSPPFTLAEFALGTQDQDSYDVSLLQGYNVGIGVTASDKGCKYAGCTDDMNTRCPAELRVEGQDGVTTVACKNACQAFGSDEYCCTGKHSTPQTCGQTRYSLMFKSACPDAFTYAYDGRSSTFTCAAGSDYLVTFCPVSS